MAKDETEIGITGLPIPKKKRSPAKQHKFEKERRANIGTNVGGQTYSGSSYSQHLMGRSTSGYNPRQRTFEEFMMIAEGKVDPNEKLPSGKTPLEKMQRKRDYHAANYMLRKREPGVGRNDQAADSHFSRASTIDHVKKSAEAGEEPHKDPKWKNTIAARRRPRASYEVPNERPGGLRAKETKAGGHRTLKRL